MNRNYVPDLTERYPEGEVMPDDGEIIAEIDDSRYKDEDEINEGRNEMTDTIIYVVAGVNRLLGWVGPAGAYSSFEKALEAGVKGDVDEFKIFYYALDGKCVGESELITNGMSINKKGELK